MLDDRWCEWLYRCVGVIRSWCDEDLGIVIAGDGCFAVGEEVHDGVSDYGVWKGVSDYVPASGVPLKELEVGDEDAMAAASGEDLVGVWHVDEGTAFGTVCVADVEADVVFHVEFPCAFVVL